MFGGKAPVEDNKTHYNTTNLRGQELMEAVNAAKSQDDKILIYFKNHRGRMFSPSQIHRALFDPTKTPIQSIRRSMTNLTTNGYLEKTEHKRVGNYGSKEYCWRLAI